MSKERLFISYAREDAATAQRLYFELKRLELNPWLDNEDLLPGQVWKVHIKQAIENSAYFLALFSTKSVSKRGFVQKELKQALDVLDEIPESEIFFIPIRLDDCKPPYERMKELNWVDLFPSFEEGLRKLLRSVSPATLTKGLQGNERLGEINRQLTEFYRPIYIRLQQDNTSWECILDVRKPAGSVDHKVAAAIERNHILPNHDEILKIIKTSRQLIEPDPVLSDILNKYIDHVEVYKALREAGDYKRFPIDMGAPWPDNFYDEIETRIKALEKEIDEIRNK